MVMPGDWSLRIPEPVHMALATLEQAGYEVWLVGGCVRDLAIGRTPLDFDLSSNALPTQVMDVFARSFATGLEHGTVTALVDSHPIEITTFRSESDYTDGRRPDRVVFESDIVKDLSRRDFTINSMAYHPSRGLLDPFDGWSDLLSGKLRTVGDPKMRFREDALRMLRALRFTLTYNLAPAPELVQAIEQEKDRATCLSVERITHELGRMMNAAHGTALLPFAASGLLSVIVKRLFGLVVNDTKLIQLLSDWIHPAWHPDQTIPLFFLASRLCLSEADFDFQVLETTPETLLEMDRLRKVLSPRSLANLKTTFQQDCRMSRPASRHGHAMLYGAGLRLHLDIDTEQDARNLAIIIRAMMKTLALDAESARMCAVDGWSLLHFIRPDLATIGRELVNLRQQVQLEQEQTTACFELPVSLSELKVQGHDLAGHLPIRGVQLGNLLERLLSHVQKEPSDNSYDRLLSLAQSWFSLS